MSKTTNQEFVAASELLLFAVVREFNSQTFFTYVGRSPENALVPRDLEEPTND